MRTLSVPAALAAALLTSAAHAAAIVPADLDPGSSYYVLFLSSTTTPATSPLTSTYDAIAANDAAAANLNAVYGPAATWRALVSTYDGTVAAGRFDPTAPIYRVDGTRIANDAADLWDGSLLAPLTLHADGSADPGATVWTGSTSAGQGESSSTLKVLGAPAGSAPLAIAETGTAGNLDGTWMESSVDPETASHPIYAFSSALTVPESTPEPSSIALLGLAAPALFRRRKH